MKERRGAVYFDVEKDSRLRLFDVEELARLDQIRADSGNIDIEARLAKLKGTKSKA